MNRSPFGYREDPAVPDFDDSRPLFIFDNVSFIMKHDCMAKIAFTSAQGDLGGALCQHFGLDWDESYLFIRNGRAYTKSTGYFEVAKELGGIWQVACIFWIVPKPLRDWVYDLIASHRYKWFGKADEACSLLTSEQRDRLIGRNQT
jgi:predicted DCC family thiol-disulfide oxidoreductase YuxK